MVRDLTPQDDDEDDFLLLTAAHVFSQVENGAPVLYAPAGPEPANGGGQHCGCIRRRVPLTNLPNISVDAAVIKPPRDFPCRNEPACGAPTGIRDLWVVDDEEEPIPVSKHGACTGYTTGELLAIAATLRIEHHKAEYTAGWMAYGNDGTPFAARGDSGAIVLDDQRRVVGMVVAVEGPEPGAGAFVHGVRQIFKALQVELP